MEIEFKQIIIGLALALLIVMYYSKDVSEATSGALGGGQAIGVVLLAVAAAVFLFGTGKVK